MSDLFSFASQYLSGYTYDVFVLVVLIMFVAFVLQFFGWMFGRR